MTSRHSRLSATISQLARWFAGAGLLIMTLIIAWQVFARYVLNASPAWAEQVALLLMIWYVMFAAAAGVREGFHIRIAVVEDAMPLRVRRLIRLLGHAVVGLFGVAMAIWGTELTIATWGHVIPTLGLPRGVAYIPFPIAGVLILAFSVEHMLAIARGSEVSGQWN
ncbi:MAG TPA: TRAP transporter small permease [Woeseiaceae bacterium]|jgi:TRAP-type C4-dicarboxylate transport system permease small subunit